MAIYPFQFMVEGQHKQKQFPDLESAKRAQRACLATARRRGWKFKTRLHDNFLLEVWRLEPVKKREPHKPKVYECTYRVGDELPNLLMGDTMKIKFLRSSQMNNHIKRLMYQANIKGWYMTTKVFGDTLTITRHVQVKGAEYKKKVKYPFSTMQRGDTVRVALPSQTRALLARNAAFTLAKSNGWQITTHIDGRRLMVTRLV